MVFNTLAVAISLVVLFPAAPLKLKVWHLQSCYLSKFNFAIVVHDAISSSLSTHFQIHHLIGDIVEELCSLHSGYLTWISLPFTYLVSGPYHWYPSQISNHPNEQCHTPSREGRGIWLRVSGWQGLCQFLLLFWRLPNRSLETWANTYPHCQNGLLCSDLLSHRLLFVQSGLLGVLSLSVRRYGFSW